MGRKEDLKRVALVKPFYQRSLTELEGSSNLPPSPPWYRIEFMSRRNCCFNEMSYASYQLEENYNIFVRYCNVILQCMSLYEGSVTPTFLRGRCLC